MPSQLSQPKLAPAARPRRRKLTSSMLVLADVADRQIAGDSVEREPPRVAEAVRPDLRRHAGPADERVVRRNRVVARGRPRGSMRRILPSSTFRFCALPFGSPWLPPSPVPDVQVAVRPELQLPGVVVVVRVRDRQDDPRAGRVRPVRIVAIAGTPRSSAPRADRCSRRRRVASWRSRAGTRSTAGRARRPR